MKIRGRLLASFLACGLVPMALLTAVNYINGTNASGEIRDNAVQAVRDVASSQLTSICEIKKQQVEDYFGSINNQILTFSEDQMVVQAMRSFRDEFANYGKQAGWDADELKDAKKSLQSYYSDQFSVEFASQNQGAKSDATAKLNELSDLALAMQYAYIAQNSNPLGSKHELTAADNGTTYDALHGQVHPVVKSFLEKFGYYDIFLVDDETGDIVYSVFKELDFATSLKDGAFAETNFGECFRKAAASNDPNSVHFVDFEQYWPSYEAPASFVASPIFDDGERIGVAMFQMPVDRINELMGLRAGLGETGETYMAGPDFLPRSDSYLDPENRSIVAAFRNASKAKIESESVRNALAGQAGVVESINYLNNPVLSAYAPLNIFGQTWALVAEVGTEQAFAAGDQISNATDQANSSMLFWSLMLSVLVTVVVGASAFYVVKALIMPINATIETLKDIAQGEGDLTRRLDENRNDELGEMAHWFNVFAGRIHDLVLIIAENAQTLNSSSTDLSSTALQLSNGANQSKSQSATVSAAAEEMSINMKAMADSSDGMSQTIREVAMSIEEMNSTIREIASNAEKSASVASEAADIVEISNSKISALGDAADEIGRVIEVIQDIAEQTNLLALNATIEAARAGEAGKGFAVVATEVKELAKQTASATDDIRARIEAIQESTGEAVSSIQAISTVISNVNEVSRTIASAVEEQSITTRQIADNISTTASAADSVARSVQETAGASQEITQNISRVDGTLQETVIGADQSRAAGDRLSALASEMNTLVGRFRTSSGNKSSDASLSA